MIDNNVDQDEWFNLYLCLGSCWVNKSRYETRYDTRYDTGYKVRTRTKESRSIDRAETENLTELNARSLDTKVELNPDVWGPGLLLSQFRITYWRRISSWTISSIFIIYRINQDQDQLYVVRWDGPTRIFQKSLFSGLITGNEVLITF